MPASAHPPHPPAQPVELIRVDRSHRAVLENLGQLYRHDLSEVYRHLPNLDGTFNNRRLDLFLAEVDPQHRAWLITVAGALGGFVMTAPISNGEMSISDFFIVRALRRTGVGRAAAGQVLAITLGPWSIGSSPTTSAFNDSGRRWPPTQSVTAGPHTTIRR